MDETPEEPGGESGEPETTQVRDRRASPEDGQVARVAVVEGPRRFSAEGREDVLGGAAEQFRIPLSTLNQKIKRLSIEIKKRLKD